MPPASDLSQVTSKGRGSSVRSVLLNFCPPGNSAPPPQTILVAYIHRLSSLLLALPPSLLLALPPSLLSIGIYVPKDPDFDELTV